MLSDRERIVVIIPALNEELAIGDVVRSVVDDVARVIVVDNGSTDDTALIAAEAGAFVVHEPKAGYGRSCLAGIAAVQEVEPQADILVFLDGDGADNPDDLPRIAAPILRDEADFVIGSRLSPKRAHDNRQASLVEQGALTPPQRFGNHLAAFLMRLFWGSAFTDLGPFRAIRTQALRSLDLSAKTFGWTVEMQVRALKAGLRCAETPVFYRRRIGVSKISGTVKGVLLAGGHILGVIAREASIDLIHALYRVFSGSSGKRTPIARVAHYDILGEGPGMPKAPQLSARQK